VSPLYAQSRRSRIAKSLSGVITGRRAVVRTKPSIKAPVIVRLKRGDRIKVVSQTQNWYRVRLKFREGGVVDGWIEKSLAKLFPPGRGPQKPRISRPRLLRDFEPNRPQSAVIQPRVSQTQGQPFRYEFQDHHGLRTFVAPVFDVYRFGAQQLRFGVSYDFRLTENISLGIPVSYSRGEGFASIQGGLDLLWYVLKWNQFSMISRTGLYLERFSGKGRSFIGGTVDLALGFRYWYNRSFSIGLEPISVEVMAIASNGIPWNLRGQILMDARFGW